MGKRLKAIESKHAEMQAKRQKHKELDPTCDFGSVIELMERAAKDLAALPVDFEFSAEALDRLEEVRHQAISLKFETEAIFDSIRGQ